MKNIIMGLLLCLSGLSALDASDPNTVAISSYKNQDYVEAHKAYLSLLESNPNNPHILYNLGNTSIKQNKLGYAIAYYRQALKQKPFDTDIRYNLNLARTLVQGQKTTTSTPLSSLVSWIHTISTSLAFYIFMIALLGWMITFKRHQKQPKDLLLNFLVILGIVCIGFGGIFSYKVIDDSQTKAVIISKKPEAHSGPSSSLPILFYVHEGIECKVLQHTDQWSQIKLKNGFSGWVQTNTLFII